MKTLEKENYRIFGSVRMIKKQFRHKKNRSNEFLKKRMDLKDRKKKDKIKKKWAIKNGYRFLEIPYWEFENIEEILRKELNI